jgi:hypothetical protein
MTAALTTAELKATDALTYAKAMNAKAKAKADAEGYTLVCVLPEDPEFFAEYANAYEYELAMAKSTLSDVFKEINGFRPRGMYRLEDMDLDAVEGEIARLYEAEEAAEAARKAEAEKVEAAYAATKAPETLTFSPFAGLKL